MIKPKNGFWDKLPRPFYCLAPMANVTDAVFRRLFAKYGKPDVTWTEFVSADGLVSEGGKRLLIDLKYTGNERPIVAQLFTGHPDKMLAAAKLARKLKFDGLDINMGCPDRAVEKQGGGSALIKSPKLALEVLAAARQGFGGHVSVKTRLGYNKIDMEWIRLLLEQRLPALTIHLRTRKELSLVPAHWDAMPDIVRLRDELSPETLIIGNGDVESLTDARAKAKQYGCDGIMIGRGAFGKPWFFEKRAHSWTPEKRLEVMLEHTKAFDKEFCAKKRIKNFAIMRKHFKAYISGWDGAKELRAKLMEAEDHKQVKKTVDEYLLSL